MPVSPYTARQPASISTLPWERKLSPPRSVGDRRLLEARRRVEDGQEALGDEVVDAALVARQPRQVVLVVGRDDRVVVGDPGVVDDAVARQQVEARDVAGAGGVGRIGAADVRGDRLQARVHVGRQVPRAGARIGQDLVLVVVRLRRPQRAVGGEAEALVRLALQRRQVVEELRLLDDRLLLDRRDAGVRALRRGGDALRLLGRLEPVARCPCARGRCTARRPPSRKVARTCQ